MGVNNEVRENLLNKLWGLKFRLDRKLALLCPKEGICTNAELNEREREELQKVFMEWPSFSGDFLFPIPGGKYTYTCAWLNNTAWDASTEYGKLRHELLDFSIKTLRDEIAPSSKQEDERFTMEDWRRDVGNGDTVESYYEWVARNRSMLGKYKVIMHEIVTHTVEVEALDQDGAKDFALCLALDGGSSVIVESNGLDVVNIDFMGEV